MALCLGVLAVALFASNFQLGGSAAGILAVVLMLGCCLLPHFLSHKGGGCCGGKDKAANESNAEKKASCH